MKTGIYTHLCDKFVVTSISVIPFIIILFLHNGTIACPRMERTANLKYTFEIHYIEYMEWPAVYTHMQVNAQEVTVKGQ